MLIEGIGAVVKCGHCSGSGSCNCGKCGQVNRVHHSVRGPCSVCAGVGNVWVGPSTVNIDSTSVNRF